MSAQASLKKRKHPDNPEISAESSTKRTKKDHDKDKKSKKGKSKSSPDGEFKVVKASIAVSIPPVFANDPMRGVLEMLDSLVMRYVPALNGVLLCHTNAHFISQVAVIKGECPFANCTVGFDATIWSPQIGMKLSGKINLASPDHISLLIHQTFNVSIPRHHIQTDSWIFEYGPAENDPEFGHDTMHSTNHDPDSTLVDEQSQGKAIVDLEHEGGRWVHKVTGELLGGEDRMLEFTVIEMTMANQMLSLLGSLQEDPFSPEHVPIPVASSRAREDVIPDDVPELVDSDEEDGFDALKKSSDNALAVKKGKEAVIEAQEEDGKKKKKKRKKSDTEGIPETGGKKPKKKKVAKGDE